MSQFCRGCSRELPKDRKGADQYCGYCRDTMNLLMGKKKSDKELPHAK